MLRTIQDAVVERNVVVGNGKGFFIYDAEYNAIKAFAITDRPVYRPGDKVRFKAMLRVLDNEGLHPWEGREALEAAFGVPAPRMTWRPA